MPDPTMVCGEENLWFLDALKRAISELILPEKTWKGTKTVLSFKLLHVLQNFWVWAWKSRHPMALFAMKICLNYPLVSAKFQLSENRSKWTPRLAKKLHLNKFQNHSNPRILFVIFFTWSLKFLVNTWGKMWK